MKYDALRVRPGSPVQWKHFDPADKVGMKDKAEGEERLAASVAAIEDLQGKLYAEDSWALLVIFQAMDAAGKDSVIKHVFSGVNPQGVAVTSFKAPTTAELDHDYLWRHVSALPGRGTIGVFNRSYYEEVLVVRVHPQILEAERIPAATRGEALWERRFEEIVNFERYLTHNGTAVLKFHLHVSREEQKKRFLDRLEHPQKNWKFQSADLKERAFWDDYRKAYREMLERTSTVDAPWYVIPADHKWVTHAVVADIIARRLEKLDPHYPRSADKDAKELRAAKKRLEAE